MQNMPDDTKVANNKTSNERITLACFLEKNHKLIAVLGVFTALTVFATTLPLKSYGYALSFMFLALVVLIWLELWQRFPSGEGTWRLFWFENILTFAILGVVGYWFIEFRPIWHKFLGILLFLLILAIISWLMKRFQIFNRVFHSKPGRHKLLRYLLGLGLIFISLAIALHLAGLITGPINRLLDEIHGFMVDGTG
jgi:protein-S-isoprenylcysteine O-methyltransferase Ste14